MADRVNGPVYRVSFGPACHENGLVYRDHGFDRDFDGLDDHANDGAGHGSDCGDCDLGAQMASGIGAYDDGQVVICRGNEIGIKVTNKINVNLTPTVNNSP